MTDEKEPLKTQLVDIEAAASVFDKMMEKDSSISLQPDNLNTVIAKEPDKDAVKELEKKEEVKEVKEVAPKEPEPKKEAAKREMPGEHPEWKKFRPQYEQTVKELDEARAQLAEFDGTKKERDALKEQIASLQKEQEELRRIDSIGKLENLPEFRAKYSQPIAAREAELKELAGYAGINPDNIFAALHKSGADKYRALEEELSATDNTILRGKISAVVDHIEQLHSARAAEMEDARGAITRHEQERAQREQQEVAQLRAHDEETFKRTAASLAKELGVSEASITKARQFFETNNDREAAMKIIIKAFHLDDRSATEAEKDKRLADMEKELAGYRESTPGLDAGTGAVNREIDDKLDFVSAIRKGASVLLPNR